LGFVAVLLVVERFSIDRAPLAARAADPIAISMAAARTKVVRSLLRLRFVMRCLLPPTLVPSVEK